MKEQNPGLNLLAIFSMAAILLYCLVDKTYVDYDFVSVNNAFHIFLKYLAYIGVNIFAFISFYYMQSSEIKISLLLRKEFTILFYSLFGLMFFTGYLHQSELVDTVHNVLPLITGKYWFITDFVIVCALSPFINNYMTSVTADVNKYLIITNVLLWSIVPTIASVFIGNSDVIFSYTQILWFITLYCIAFYFRQHSNFVNNKIFNGMNSAIMWFVLLMISLIGIKYLGLNYEFFKDKEYAFSSENNFLIAMCSINIFVEFKKLKIKFIDKKVLVPVFDCLLGVYIFFNNEYLLNLIDVNIFGGTLFEDTESFFNFVSNNYIIYTFIIFIIVFIFCFLTEYARLYLIEDPLFNIGSKIYEKAKENKGKKRKNSLIVFNEDTQMVETKPQKKKKERKVLQINLTGIKNYLPIIKIKTDNVTVIDNSEDVVANVKDISVSTSENKVSGYLERLKNRKKYKTKINKTIEEQASIDDCDLDIEKNINSVKKIFLNLSKLNKSNKKVNRDIDNDKCVEMEIKSEQQFEILENLKLKDTIIPDEGFVVKSNTEQNVMETQDVIESSDAILEFLYSDNHKERHLAKNNNYSYPDAITDFYGELLDDILSNDDDLSADFIDIDSGLIKNLSESDTNLLSIDDICLNQESRIEINIDLSNDDTDVKIIESNDASVKGDIGTADINKKYNKKIKTKKERVGISVLSKISNLNDDDNDDYNDEKDDCDSQFAIEDELDSYSDIHDDFSDEFSDEDVPSSYDDLLDYNDDLDGFLENNDADDPSNYEN